MREIVSNFDKFCELVEQQEEGTIFRHNDAGDFPAEGRRARYLLTDDKQNKTGKSLRSRTSRSSCPKSCTLYDVCYASTGPISWHWKKLKNWNVSGGDNLNWRAMLKLAKSASHLVGWTYTHWPWKRYFKSIKKANELGFTVNVSTECPKDAVKAFKKGLPTTLVAPENVDKTITIDGVKCITCPAVLNKEFTCVDCGGKKKPLCARQDRDYIIMFPAHGSRKNKVYHKIKSYWKGVC
jgi:hypothetical protein